MVVLNYIVLFFRLKLITPFQYRSKYFLNGTCFEVDLSCNTFNPLNGSCLTCWPNSQRTSNGLCSQATTTRTVPFCYPGTHLFQSICIPDACLAALPNGQCTACVNTAFKLTSDGQCIEIDCSIGLFFSVALDSCAFWPPRCLAMNALTQKCTKCFEGFFPDSNGVCTSPCPAGRFFVNNDCYLLPPRCLSLSNVLHCQKCEEGYRLIQGECTLCNGPNPLFPCVFCPLDHFVSSLGQCVRTARFCDSIDQATGLCLTCASGAIPVEGICCGFGQALQNGVCVDGSLSINGGQNSQQSQNQNQNQVPQFDSTYYRHCKIYSPPLNKCIECRNGHTFSLTPKGSDLCL